MDWIYDPVSELIARIRLPIPSLTDFLPTAQRNEPQAIMPHERDFRHRDVRTRQQLRADNHHLRDRLDEQQITISEHEDMNRRMRRALHEARAKSNELHLRLQQQKADLLGELEQEKAQRNKEVSAYKHMILKSTELHHYKTDEDICSAWDKLFNDIQGWAFRVNRAMKPDFRSPKQTLWLTSSMPLWHSNQSPNYKLNIIIATVAVTIEKAFRECGVFGLSSYALFAGLTDMAQSFKDVKDNAEYKKWLMVTHDLLQETHVQQLNEARTATAIAMLNETEGTLQNFCSMQLTENFQRELVNIFEFAVDVLGCLHFHPASFHVGILQAQSSKGPGLRHFETRFMDDITGQGDDDLPQCGVQGSVFPAVFKFRGEDGNNIDRITVCKAKVMAYNPKCP